jgi:hypothetical protein
MVVAPNMNVVRGGVLIRFATNLSLGLGGVLTRRNLSRSLGLLIAITRVIRTPRMVFTNLIMTIHVNRTVDRPLMNLVTTRRYKGTMLKIQGKGIKNHLS